MFDLRLKKSKQKNSNIWNSKNTFKHKSKPLNIKVKQSSIKSPFLKIHNKKYYTGFGQLNKMFKDDDKDGVANVFDCHPRDPKRHGALLKEEISQRLYKTPYKQLKKQERRSRAEFEQRFRGALENYAKKQKIKNRYERVERAFANRKFVGPTAVVSHFEKHPELLPKLKPGQKIQIMQPEYQVGPHFLIGRTSPEKEIEIAPFQHKEENVGETIEHELVHASQPKHRETTIQLPYEEYINLPREKEAMEAYPAHMKEREEWKEPQPEALQALEYSEMDQTDVPSDIKYEGSAQELIDTSNEDEENEDERRS